MEERLAERVRVFRESGQVRPEVADFVTGELEALAGEGLAVREETAGMLTSHLMMALTRLLDGEALDDAATEEQLAAELAGHPEAVARARALAARAEEVLGARLPPSEHGFLALHLAVLTSGPRAG
jgi:hypothetical protein